MRNLLRALRARHDIVQSRIDSEQVARRPDSLRVAALKKIKLQIKDQIVSLERMAANGRAEQQLTRH
jgi:hypothetical protein